MKKTYYKIQPQGDKSYCVLDAHDLLSLSDWLEGAETGSLILEVSTIEMTEEEFEALPEYEG